MTTWTKTNTTKTITIPVKSGHAPPAGCAGVIPGKPTLTFDAHELALAVAYCAYLNQIPKAREAEHAHSMSAMIDMHVDPASADFALLPSAGKLKDFVGTYLTGVVAAGLSYLFMQAEGYVWFGHFENGHGGNPGAKKSPDFVFEHGLTHELAISESKGTRKKKGQAFARKGYEKQVAPHLGYPIYHGTATRGFCVGSRFGDTLKADLVVHYTEPAPVAPPGGLASAPPVSKPPPYAPSWVQQASFTRSMDLVFGSSRRHSIYFDARFVSEQEIDWDWDWPPEAVNTVNWLDRDWIVHRRASIFRPRDGGPVIEFAINNPQALPVIWADFLLSPIDDLIWAFDKETYDAFRGELDLVRKTPPRFCPPPETFDRLRRRARETGGAVAANGLALLPISVWRATENVIG